MAFRPVTAYSEFVVRRPCVVLLSCILVCIAFIGGAIARGVLPEFDKAGKGFEPRGTPLADKLYAVDRALEKSQCAGDISALPNVQSHFYLAEYPDENGPFPECAPATPGDTCRRAFDGECQSRIDPEATERPDCPPDTDVTDCSYSDRRQMQSSFGGAAGDTSRTCYSERWQLTQTWGVMLVFESSGGSDLLSAAALRGMCDFAEQTEGKVRGSHCDERTRDGSCCGVRSIGTYAALLAGRSSCAELTDDDAASFRSLLSSCAAEYQAGVLDYQHFDTNPWTPSPPSAPPGMASVDCTRFNAVYDTLNALVDTNYLSSGGVASYARVMLPYFDEAALTDLHYDFLTSQVGKSFGGAELTAYELMNGSLKMTLFSNILFTNDMPLIFSGMLIVLVFMWLYSGSLCVTLMSFLQINLSIGMAFGVFMVVLWLPFFPFINMTGTFLCLGIGADDVFVMLQSFDDAIRARGKSDAGIDAKLIRDVLFDGGAATLVTSLTTAGAFFASMSSSIIAIKAFGVFCGLVVMCDWLTMIFFLPPLAVLYERHWSRCCCSLQATRCVNLPLAANERQLERKSLGERFEACLGFPLTHRLLKFVWLAASIGLSFGVGSAFMSTDLRLPYPSSAEMQMLASDNPLERYCCVEPQVKSKFTLGAPGSDNGNRFVVFLFGIDPVDESNHWDPLSYPDAKLLGGMDFTSRASQSFLYDFSARARDSSWFEIPRDTVSEYAQNDVDLSTSPAFPFNTSLEMALYAWTQPCYSDGALQSPSGQCCGLSRAAFPFEPSLFGTCLGEYIAHENRRHSDGAPATAGASYWELTMQPGMNVWWSGGVIRAMTLVFPTRFMYQETYQPTHDFWTELQDWTAAELTQAPAGLQGGFVSVPFRQLGYYSLQVAMADSSSQSTYIALIVALIVLALFTRNVLVAIYTTLTVALIMLTVSGTLSLLGWEQGIMESIIISCGIGMACDFSAHIGFAYRQANIRREATTRDALAKLAARRMAPALTAAAMSTGVMGAFMCFSGTLFTIRFGIFILLLMSFGWLFALFFLLPLLATIGPLGNCGEPYALCQKKRASSPDFQTTTTPAESASVST